MPENKFFRHYEGAMRPKQSYWQKDCFTLLAMTVGIIACFAFILQDFKHIKTISVNGKFLTTDNLNNFYIITDANELIKFNSSGEKQYTYSEKNFGKLSFVDASNPLKILALYPEYSTVVTLDKTLSPIGNYNLKQAGIFRANAVCLAQDNNIWIYDERDFKLKKIDVNLKVIQQSDDLSLLLQNSIKPDFILERNNWIFVNDPQTGILQFDNYATYFKTIPIKNLTNFQVLGDRIFYFENNSLNSFHALNLQSETISLPDSLDVTQVRIEKDIVYLLKKNQVDLYSF